jgi:hypothetical protein
MELSWLQPEKGKMVNSNGALIAVGWRSDRQLTSTVTEGVVAAELILTEPPP